MKHKWLYISLLLILAGLVGFACVMTALDWDFKRLSTVEYETNSYEITETISGISIDTDTSDIAFLPSEGGKISVVCYEQVNATHTVTVADGTLEIKLTDTRKWYEKVSIANFNSPKITVYVPEEICFALKVDASTGEIEIAREIKLDYVDITLSTGNVKTLASAKNSVKIKASTGDITAENIGCGGDLNLEVSTGKISVSRLVCDGDIKITVSTGKTCLSDVTCNNLTSGGSTGDLHLKNTVATGKFDIERSTGDITLDGCDAGEITIETSTGDVTGTLLSSKIFFAEVSTGDVDVPKTTEGGRCEITTSTGDIEISIK